MHRPLDLSERAHLWTPSEIPELAVDAALEGKSALLRISNLHWKCTLHHIDRLLLLDGQCAAKRTKDIDLDPRWLRILEDDGGYPRGVALVLFKNGKSARFVVEHFNGRRLLGRAVVMEYSSYQVPHGRRRPKYDVRQRFAAKQGTVSRVLLSNLKGDCTAKDIEQFLEKTMKEKWGNDEHRVLDVHLLHNLQRVCG